MPKKLRLWRSFRGKLYASFAVLIGLSAAIGIAGYLQLAQVETLSSEVFDATTAHGLAQELAVQLADLDHNLDDYLVIGDGVTRAAVEEDLVAIDATLANLEELPSPHQDPDHAHDIDGAILATAQLRFHIDALVIGDISDIGDRNRLIADVFKDFENVRTLFNEYNAESLTHVHASIKSQTGILATFSTQLIVFGLLILIILLATSLYVGNSVRSIGKVTDTALAIAAGDLDRHVSTQRRDEIGLLGGAFNSMTDQLSSLIDSLEHRVEERTAQLSALNATLQDEVNERLHAEQELRRSKEFAETVLNSMTESIAIIDTNDFTIVGANKVFTDTAAVESAEELIGLKCYAVTRGRSEPCSPPGDACPLVDLKTGHAVASVEHSHRDANGRTRYAEVSISPVLDASGAMSRIVHISRDITERKAAEQALQEYATRLETALQDLGRAQAQLLQSQKLEAIGGLAAGVAHEVNTPVQYVGDNTRFLQEAFDDLISLQKQVDELILSRADHLDKATRTAYQTARDNADVDFLLDEIPGAIEETIDGVDRISEIVRALKEFSHPGGTDKSPVDLNRLVSNTVAVSKNEWKYVADLTTDLDPDLDQVSALPGPLGQALLVLIVNAADAIGEVVGDGSEGLGTISISTSSDEVAAEIRVTDTGTGIPDDIHDKVFEHFFTTKDVGQGSGQGLAIAHSIIVEQHGGDLDFEPAAGGGTTFRIRIPKETSDAAEAA